MIPEVDHHLFEVAFGELAVGNHVTGVGGPAVAAWLQPVRSTEPDCGRRTPGLRGAVRVVSPRKLLARRWDRHR